MDIYKLLWIGAIAHIGARWVHGLPAQGDRVVRRQPIIWVHMHVGIMVVVVGHHVLVVVVVVVFVPVTELLPSHTWVLLFGVLETRVALCVGNTDRLISVGVGDCDRLTNAGLEKKEGILKARVGEGDSEITPRAV